MQPLHAVVIHLRYDPRAADMLRPPKAEVPPNSPLNPTKNTPSQIAVLDHGEAIVLSEEGGKWIKLKLKGRKLNGLFYAVQQEGSKIPIFQQSELPEPSVLKPS